jgi:hypothetical protein
MSEMPEMLEKMREEIIQILGDQETQDKLDQETFAVDETCRTANVAYEYSWQVCKEAEKARSAAWKVLLEALRNTSGRHIHAIEDVVSILVDDEISEACKSEIEVFKAMSKLHNSVGDLGDHTCDTLCVSLVNSTAYHTAIERLYKSFARNSVEQVAA